MKSNFIDLFGFTYYYTSTGVVFIILVNTRKVTGDLEIVEMDFSYSSIHKRSSYAGYRNDTVTITVPVCMDSEETAQKSRRALVTMARVAASKEMRTRFGYIL